MPSKEQLIEHLPPHFIHYQPRDIVSGDFYWMTQHGDRTFFAAVDCTGHGVPGAFMSVLGSNLLHQIVDENNITEPEVILSELDRRVSETLRQSFGGDSKDGMDLALIVLHAPNADGFRIIEYAGAGRPLWHLHGDGVSEYKSAKYSCGGSQHEDKAYPASRIQVASGDRIFIFSDGPVDQFGGPKGRKLGSKQLQSFLQETSTQSIAAQGEAFNLFFNDWMENKTQLDDVLLVGLAV